MKLIQNAIAFIVLFHVFSLAATPASISPGLAGKSLEEALRILQRKGVNILYSSDLVRPDMMVASEPVGEESRQIVEELLSAHGLQLQRGPASTLLVVPASLPPKFQKLLETSLQGDRYSKPLEEIMIVPFVSIYLTARDDDDRFVTNLSASDFVLKEDGKQQSIVEFLNSGNHGEKIEEPLNLLILLDSSGSMNDNFAGGMKHDVIKNAASFLLDHLRPEDRVMVMGFNSPSWTISEMTQDVAATRARLALEKVAGGKTAIFDSLMAGLRNIQELSGRKIIVLCSDGEDNSSVTTLKDLILTLESSDVTVFTLGVNFNQRIPKHAREGLSKVAEVTGGYAFFSDNPNELLARVDKVGKAMRSHYTLGYHPPAPSLRGWRHVVVECKVPWVRLRYKKAYLF